MSFLYNVDTPIIDISFRFWGNVYSMYSKIRKVHPVNSFDIVCRNRLLRLSLFEIFTNLVFNYFHFLL